MRGQTNNGPHLAGSSWRGESPLKVMFKTMFSPLTMSQPETMTREELNIKSDTAQSSDRW